MGDPKIHCIVVCKNEADVVGVCLAAASEWADYIYVYDGASTDTTWEIVQRMGNGKIIPWKQDGKVFKEGLRAEVFNEFRHLARPGDWWLQLNADEFYSESPRDFLKQVPAQENFVWGIMAEYVLTEKDLSTVNFDLPFSQIMPMLRHYYVAWSEPRAFRYRDRLVWSDDCAWPQHVGLVARKRIIYKHYPCRSPKQIQTRLEVRKANRERGFEGWKKADEDWRASVKKSGEFLYDDGVKPLVINETVLPKHLEKPHIRLLKRVLHGAQIWP